MPEFPQKLWYPILSSKELRVRPLRIQRLGLWLILWRDEKGLVHANPDRCPHLGASFATASVQEGHLVCPFHGFTFDGAGVCRRVPAQESDQPIPKGLRLKIYPVRELEDLIWLWFGDFHAVDELPTIPFFKELESRRSGSWVVADWNAALTRVIENQLDVSHLPFVHAKTIGRGRRARVEGPWVEAETHAIRLWNAAPPEMTGQKKTVQFRSERPPDIHFLFPGIWKLHISQGIQLLGVFVPIEAQKTRFYVRTYHRFQWPLIRLLVNLVFAFSNRQILKEDQAVVESLTPASSLDANDDQLIGADRAIVLFRKRFRALLALDQSNQT